MDKNEVIKLVDDRLKQVNGGLEFVIIRDGVRQDHEWWYVPVVTSRHGKDVPREVTINIFANIETELEESNDLTVMFVPAIA